SHRGVQARVAVRDTPCPGDAVGARIAEAVIAVMPETEIERKLVEKLAAIFPDKGMDLPMKARIEMRSGVGLPLPDITAGELMMRGDEFWRIKGVARLIARLYPVPFGRGEGGKEQWRV